jgi:glycosyltransferase involved in cell wall biosynthesis|tara:strand:+ start:8727 stop:9374 length:648 start_codon:yes stop_codon:yes gene_type:complete
MSKLKKISVIIPVYNQERYIARCLHSILSQSFHEDLYEVIVINDASTDNTSFVLEQFSKNITVIKNNINIGLPGSLNIGIKNSNSQYIVRIDSDDYVNSKFLEILYMFTNYNSHVNAYACDYHLIDENEEIIETVNCMEKPIGCGIIFRRQDLIKIGMYDEQFLLNEDKDLRSRFENEFVINRVELPLYRYRKHENNMTNNKKVMNYYDKKLKEK